MSEELPQANDENVERIASRLFDYITTVCMSRHTMKLEICEALYEMQAIAKGEKHEPVAQVYINGERV
jgi:hypothetical protein